MIFSFINPPSFHRGEIEEDSLVAPFMGEEDGDEERFASVVDTGRWRNMKVSDRVKRRKMR